MRRKLHLEAFRLVRQPVRSATAAPGSTPQGLSISEGLPEPYLCDRRASSYPASNGAHNRLFCRQCLRPTSRGSRRGSDSYRDRSPTTNDPSKARVSVLVVICSWRQQKASLRLPDFPAPLFNSSGAARMGEERDTSRGLRILFRAPVVPS